MNYAKIAGQFVCKMAMPLALMFAACSTDDGSRVSGGAEEETGIVATLQVYAYYTASGSVAREAGSSENGSVGVSLPQNLFSEKGKVVLTELDPETLAPVGDSSLTTKFRSKYDNVRFTDVALKTPIVSLEAIADSVSLMAIVDVRDSGRFVIDELSHLVAYRVKKLVESGLSFASAKAQAETEVAETFGFGDQNPFADGELTDSSTVNLWRRAFNEMVPIDLLNQMGTEFADAGNAAGISDASKKSLTHVIERSLIMDILEYPSAVYEVAGEWPAAYYQECLRKKDYFAGMLASVFGAGECSSEKEGVLVNVAGDFREIGCRSGSWDLLFSKAKRYYVEHSFGTMVDSRDGRTYKTVTIDLGGKSQTWMAENLNYATDNSYCYNNDTSWCSTYGREYLFIKTLDTSLYRNYTNVDECLALRMDRYFEGWDVSWGRKTAKDTLYALSWAEECYEWSTDIYAPFNVNWEKVLDSMEVLNLDVCPEGWRVPEFEDWATLLHYLDNRFEFDPVEENFVDRIKPEFELLFENRGDPVGFGMKPLIDVYYYDSFNGLGFDLYDTGKYLFLPHKVDGDMVGKIYTYFLSSWMSEYGYDRYGYDYVGDYDDGFIRCIKED